MLGPGCIDNRLGLLARVLGTQHVLIQDEAQGLFGVNRVRLQVGGTLLLLRREKVVNGGDERDDFGDDVEALGDGGQMRCILTEGEGARVLEEGVVLLSGQAADCGIVRQQGVGGTDGTVLTDIERVHGRRAGAAIV